MRLSPHVSEFTAGDTLWLLSFTFGCYLLLYRIPVKKKTPCLRQESRGKISPFSRTGSVLVVDLEVLSQVLEQSLDCCRILVVLQNDLTYPKNAFPTETVEKYRAAAEKLAQDPTSNAVTLDGDKMVTRTSLG